MDNDTLTLFTSRGQPLSGAVVALFDAAPKQWLPYAIGLLIGYPLLVRSLRYRRIQNLQKKCNYPTRESMAKMTDEEAFMIQRQLGTFEFPFMFLKSLQFALFRTYGIPSISHLLTKTTQFSNPNTSLKRYTDTAALVNEMVGNSPTSYRAFVSIARTRFLHSGYRASGKILESDMLYTLALFALEPVRFIGRFEWRELTDLERCALGTFWKSVGDGLGISFEELPSAASGFKDGIQWLEEIEAWSEAYEEKYMVPDVKNRETADQTTAVIVYMLPPALHPIGLQFVSFMMDERLRKAMLYDPPSPFWSSVFSVLLTTRKLFIRYLMLPRPQFLKVNNISQQPDEHNKFYLTSWEAAPYYVKPTFWNRWGPTAWLTWALGRPVPGDEGDKYYPSGYHIQDIGPKFFEGKGQKAIEETMKELEITRTGKCPFH
ncbi:uncharacterized protein N7483_003330 [Penicillium malachiteum]|uniref:uncharacterized protein n=1 Tax=Penicillium malachiteum TaxID=1324776 RepID=UPI00254845C2|nr:uncharacterized protein N7483_003330 [Penicillium malachiteum]KAJ5728822.1 hypothetical protein N7483_003330 [Penicillium malachiteum]